MTESRHGSDRPPAGDMEPHPVEGDTPGKVPRERVDRAHRYPLELPVELGPLRGVTRDISVSGIRFETEELGAASLREGETVRVVLRFPSAVHGRDYQLHIVGTVVRVDTVSSGRIVAVATEEFRLGEPPAAEV